MRSARGAVGSRLSLVAKRDHHLIAPMAQRLEARMGGNKFKAKTVLAIKLARAVYFMLKNQAVFNPERLVMALEHGGRPQGLGPGRSQPGRSHCKQLKGEARMSRSSSSVAREAPDAALGTSALRSI